MKKYLMTILGKRSSKYAGNYAVSLVLILAIVCGLNYVGVRHVKRFDMTRSGLYTLAPQTIQTLSNLNREIRILAFFPGGHHAPLKELLAEYDALSNHLRYEFIDPDKQNHIARQYDVTLYGVARNPFTNESMRYGTVIVSLDDRTERIEKGPGGGEIEEQDLTNAIIKIGRSETKKVYFLQGHGEKTLDSSDTMGYSLAAGALEAQGYAVEPINLAEMGMIPEDAGVIVVAGPENDPFPLEMELMEKFLETGGGALFMVDPPSSPSFSDFFSKWGVVADNNVVLDVSGARLMGTSESMPLVLGYEHHPITERFNAMSFFPFTRSIRPAEDVPYGTDVQPLFYSSERSWGKTDLNNTNADFDPAKDMDGPLSLAVAVSREIQEATDEKPAIDARMVIVGTSNFAIDTFFSAQGNGNLFLNMISWLARDDDLISLRPKSSDDRRILLSGEQLAMVRVFTIFLLPGVAFFIGIVVFIHRRGM